MKKFTIALFALTLTFPLGAQAQDRMTQEQLVQYATDRNICAGSSVVSAGYVSATDNRIAVTCANAGGTGAQSAGLSGMGGAGVAAAALAGLGIVALAAGGGGSSSTSDTQ